MKEVFIGKKNVSPLTPAYSNERPQEDRYSKEGIQVDLR
jgi:hypothetical protein